MSTHRHFDKICCVILAFTLILAALFMNAENFGIKKTSAATGYEKTLFDTSKVHYVNIIMDNWDEFTENCKSEEYYNCTVVIDNEAYKNVAIRGKGNTSLSQVSNDRYSYKIEFDHYDSSKNYYGLDKLCLNNIIQDNTYMKDYLCYRMMNEMGVASPLCSFAYITVNGEDWGLYLAVEGVEESFLSRNYGKDYGELYKPDSMSMGGGRGNGEKFDTDGFSGDSESGSNAEVDNRGQNNNNGNQSDIPQTENDSQSGQKPDKTEQPDGMQGGERNAGGGGENGSDDVLLKYIDDEFDSYSNIFDNAKTDITDADKARLIKALKKLSNDEDLGNTVDVQAVIRYFAVHNFVLNFDSYTGSMIHNYYLYEKDGRLQMIPWDYNLAFGGFQSMGSATSLVNYPIDSPVSGGNLSDRPMIAWIFNNEEYTELYHNYLSEFITSYFDSGYFSEMIDGVNTMIAPYVEKGPTKFCTYEEFEKGITTLKEFCLLRAESVSRQLDGTIGSTSDTQKSDTLIDAGDLQISDMGSMNNTAGGDKDKISDDKQKPQAEAEENTEENNLSEDSSSADNSTSHVDAKPQKPDRNGESKEMPNDENGTAPPKFSNGGERQSGVGGSQPQMPDDSSKASNGGQTQPESQNTTTPYLWAAIGISISVLLSGLVFAAVFKRRR